MLKEESIDEILQLTQRKLVVLNMILILDLTPEMRFSF